jgi:uncharacterized protein (DUF3084 family)
MRKTRTKKQEIAHRKETIRVIDAEINRLEWELVRINKEIVRLKDLGHIQDLILDDLLRKD